MWIDGPDAVIVLCIMIVTASLCIYWLTHSHRF